ncbi:hypothetical protein C8J56DRAFT_319503 [Mycena floridula]|nr:hypothetical protein C8J56DRAFT_319503 [Mycena floridula]
MEAPKRKVTVKLNYNANNEPSGSVPRSPYSRPTSPSKPQSPATFRPKAKVTSSATPNSLARNNNASKPSSTVSSSSRLEPTTQRHTTTPRALSPAKLNAKLPINGASSGQVKSRPTVIRAQLRPTSSHSTPGTPDSNRLNNESDSLKTRRASMTFQLPVSESFPDYSEANVEPAPKIKSKLSRVAIQQDTSPNPLPRRARVPSISSSSLSQSSATSPDFIVYPITTATPAANPHRYVTTRSPPISHYRPAFSPPKAESNGAQWMSARVDPSNIPLPPHSPPTSALSFSSRSSVSKSSISQTADSADSEGSGVSIRPNDSPNLHSAIEKLASFAALGLAEEDFSGDSGYDQEPDQTERKVKAEAKSNRKIADLEITNQSLLAINASLEATRHRQAKEIRELRRKLRESRLSLPPRAFKAVKSSDVEEESDGDDEEDEEELEEGATDKAYLRIKLLLDGLLTSGRTALESEPADLLPQGTKAGAKVLSAEEVRNWIDSDYTKPVSPALVAVPDSDGSDHSQSEDEVEAMTIPRDSPSPSSSPPSIRVTLS